MLLGLSLVHHRGRGEQVCEKKRRENPPCMWCSFQEVGCKRTQELYPNISPYFRATRKGCTSSCKLPKVHFRPYLTAFQRNEYISVKYKNKLTMSKTKNQDVRQGPQDLSCGGKGPCREKDFEVDERKNEGTRKIRLAFSMG